MFSKLLVGNGRMKAQMCETIKVVDGKNREDYIWPNKVKSSYEVDSSVTKKFDSMTVTTQVQGNGNQNSGGNIVNVSLVMKYLN